MKNRKQRTVLAVALLLGATCTCSFVQAAEEKVHGKVNAAGELRNADGGVLGKVVMTKPGVAFDIDLMTIQQNGSVIDSAGEEVGRMVLGPLYESAAAPPLASAGSEDVAERIIEAPVVSETAPAAIRTGNSGTRVQGKVNSCGEFRDANGALLGKVFMDDPALGWDIETMSVRNDGVVVDAGGKEVGRVKMKRPGELEDAPLSLPVDSGLAPAAPPGTASSAFAPVAPTPTAAPAAVVASPVSTTAASQSASAAEPNAMKFQGSVNGAGEVYADGKLAARVVMNDAEPRFDLDKMTINPDGSVVDGTGAKVGRLVFEKDFSVKVGSSADLDVQPASPGRGITEYGSAMAVPLPDTGVSSYSDVTVGVPGTGVRNYSGPSATSSSYVSEYRSSGTNGSAPTTGSTTERYSGAAVKSTSSGVPTATTSRGSEAISSGSVSSERTTTNAASKDSRRAVMGIREEDLTARKSKVEDRISSELSEGRITEAQASQLRSDLDVASQAQERYLRDGILADREVRELYRIYDIAMYNLDRYLARNARKAIGLRTR